MKPPCMNALVLVALLLFLAPVQADELEVYLNSQGSGLTDNLQYTVQDGIVAEVVDGALSIAQAQQRCLRLMHDLGQAPLGVAVRAVVIVSGLNTPQQEVYSCF